MHDREHFLLAPRLADDLHADREALHRVDVVRALGPIQLIFEELRAVSGRRTPLIRQRVARRVDTGNGDDANGRVNHVVYQRRARYRREPVTPAVRDRGHCLHWRDHRVQAWGAAPQRAACCLFERYLIRDDVVVLPHRLLMRAREE